ncbi:hypothetical protein F7725_025735 [Dissostichus mawsoni]|uniref:Uncharacterized protein n=1 Tax=Dissostichus mawsoni TaxID=36200 RepID=A0A7J5X524_DISMA|nr:hypothetical protein F7725_025735 [Dissostichus mawsoni]
MPPPLLYPMEADSDDSSGKSSDEDLQRSAHEEITELYFKFEVKEVLLEMLQEQSTVLSLSVCELIVPVWCVQVLLEMLQEQSTVLSLSVCELIVPVWCVQVLFEMLREQSTVLSLSVCELGAEGRRRSFDLSVTAFLRRVALDFCDLPGGGLLSGLPAPHQSSAVHLQLLSSALPQRARAPLLRTGGRRGGPAQVWTPRCRCRRGARRRCSLVSGTSWGHRGGGYSDMEKVDGKVTLRLGCIQILYMHQFLMALLDQFPSGSCCGGSAVMPDSMQFRVPSLIQGPVPFRVLLWRICRSCCGGSAVMADSMQFRVPSLIQGPAPFRVLLWRICSDA